MRLLVVTAVPAERDAVTAALGTPEEHALPGRTLHRVRTRTGDREASGARSRTGHGALPVTAGRAPTGGGASSRPGTEPGTQLWTGPGTGSGTEPGTGTVTVDVLAVGAGPAAAAAGTATALALHPNGLPYDVVVSAGIGGGFQPHAPVGSLVVAESIVAAELGAETADGFVPVEELGFGRSAHRPPEQHARRLAEALGALHAPVLTVSTVTGTAARAAELARRHPGAGAEAMEGFGVAEAAAAHGLPVFEIRAVSNPVGPRDRAAWRVKEALDALGRAFPTVVRQLAGQGGTMTKETP
ncbi:futalosine hydrolase [Streptomyces sp. GC420]|uniref:futalosine hydrolase n=1 Tax=Streptomyces sp. GC420 TaxID=2697568 RepID=UPI001414D4ED|nr:futalosine hydrolase [Streptomyces sp. GC420]NBM16492.1 futalosine hydrolase [Streptomyces sp. GC420]